MAGISGLRTLNGSARPEPLLFTEKLLRARAVRGPANWFRPKFVKFGCCFPGTLRQFLGGFQSDNSGASRGLTYKVQCHRTAHCVPKHKITSRCTRMRQPPDSVNKVHPPHRVTLVVMQQGRRAQLCRNSTAQQWGMVAHENEVQVDAAMWLAVFRSHCGTRSTQAQSFLFVWHRSERWATHPISVH